MVKAISVENLSMTYGNKKEKIIAVDNISFTVYQGEIFSFLGPSGAGKTTTQRILTTLLPISGGTADVAGCNVLTDAKKVRTKIGYVSQLGGADPNATVHENLELSGKLYGLSKDVTAQRIDKLSKLLDFHELLSRFVRTLSGGQKRRVEIAQGILHEPKVLFLDEPTTGLDPQNRANLWQHIKKLRDNGMTIFLTTHYLEEADALSDRLIILDHGKIIAEGTPTELKKKISGEAISIELKNSRDAEKMKQLFNQLAIGNVIETGMNFTIYTSKGEELVAHIFEYTKEHHIELANISLSMPSLNDVFLALTGQELRDGGKEGEQ
ncbi:ATP-binding cassette domain-containing protein [Virgibacillus dakarensis]|uniref:Daunorubicin resistance protein DrrA family ABC transporter ATP-binding protein n=1 Tax=Lentibacillus populi TaxID=1827502 RepID=A0A9W5X4F9_9BACI|nr:MULTISPECIES: ATP-binding cassette domain-containing protein [Bacillaceae]MBT2214925.1 ATP-binding cassette domain-containing protein [Virgibacillus dakarensis]MTW84799.1 ATP-binding cassette domain-containing protein [Virgibacillus dakarensis]GGB31751.1 daunorubicin resistance protein DrrA family ABC transporter ATP-binding protein [Lentibacillus populi]